MRRHRGRIDPDTHVWIASSALAEMVAEAQRLTELETGGMLLGYASPATSPEELMVELAIGPGPKATHARRSFRPDGPWQQEELTRTYHESGRITTYLGDWHTHPGGPPVPSRRDIRTARKIARKRSARLPRPLMLILGGPCDEQWALRAYRLSAGCLVPVVCEVLDS